LKRSTSILTYPSKGNFERLLEIRRLCKLSPGDAGLTSFPFRHLRPFHITQILTQEKIETEKLMKNRVFRGLIGFLIATTPVSCQLMGWAGSGGGGAASMYVLICVFVKIFLIATMVYREYYFEKALPFTDIPFWGG
jgi:hypothetical protein